jgi:hypothetical protein
MKLFTLNKPLQEEAFDQFLHTLCAFSIVWITSRLGYDLNWLQGLFVAGCTGLVREITEGGDFFGGGSIRDLIFWCAGGILGGYL